MIFASPLMFFWLLAPVALLVWEITRRRRNLATGGHPKILRAEAGTHRVEMKPTAATPRRGPRIWLFLGLCLAICALARPQWGNLEEPVFDQSREILIAMDLSRSMLSTDVKPSRLERSKLLIQSLLDQLKGERVGLVIFSGTAFLQAPLSSDYGILREFLPELKPDYLPEGGTNYRALIDASVEAFSEGDAADRYLIILSDGEATEENWRDRVEALKKKNIKVIGLGVGTSGGSMIPDESGGFVKDDRGAVVFSRLESGTLRDLSKATDGLYQDASGWVDLAGVIKTTVDRGQKGKFMEKVQVRHIERFQWPLALGAWFLLLSFFYEFPVRPKPRAIALRGTATPTSSNPPVLKTVAMLALSLGAFFTARPLRAQTPPPSPPSESAPAAALSKMTGRLSVQDRQSARDWSEFARETLTFGQKLKSAQKPVPEGPINDALAAVEQGRQLDPKLTDWARLREELQGLLQKDPPQKQDQKDQKDQKPNDDKSSDQKDQDKKSSDGKDGKDGKKDKSSDPSKDGKDDQKSGQDKKNANDDSSDKNQDDGDKKSPPPDPSKGKSAFGDMKDKTPPPAQNQQPQPAPDPGEMQKVGGAKDNKAEAPPSDPSLALPLQKLEQVRRKDAPGELFQFLNGDQKSAPPPKNSKNW